MSWPSDGSAYGKQHTFAGDIEPMVLRWGYGGKKSRADAGEDTQGYPRIDEGHTT